MGLPRRRHSVLPGFGLTMGYTLLYLSLIVLIPLTALFVKTAGLTAGEFWATVSNPRVVASYKLTFGTSLIAASINAVFGLIVAWTLVRYRFPGQRLVDAMVDLPFALPTAVSGIALTAIYAGNGWIGQYLEPLGIKVMLVEPSGFRTDWAGRSANASKRQIDDYAATAGAVRSQLRAISGKQSGDPVRAAHAIVKAIKSRNPPHHLLLGNDAYDAATAKLEELRKEFSAWEAVARGADFPKE